jgi:hypothetical protein
MAVRHHGLETLASRPPAAQRRYIGFDPGLVDDDQQRGVNPVSVQLAALRLAGDIGPILLLGGPICFFQAQALGVNETSPPKDLFRCHARPVPLSTSVM